jgi:hypothetical protein
VEAPVGSAYAIPTISMTPTSASKAVRKAAFAKILGTAALAAFESKYLRNATTSLSGR